MYPFEEYFNVSLKDVPYESSAEELEDHLRFLDMLLEGYAEQKGLGREKKLFSRGLVITESEMKRYFEMPPLMRERDACDPLLATWARQALEYLDERAEATGDPLEDHSRMPFNYVRLAFDLSDDEALAVLLALAPEIDRRYERIYGFLQDDVSHTKPTLGLLHALRMRIADDYDGRTSIPRPLDDKTFTYFFAPCDDAPALERQLVLNPLMRSVLLGSEDVECLDPEYAYAYAEDEGIPTFFEEQAAELEYALSDGGSKPLYLSAEDQETPLHLLHAYCLDHGEKLYVVDINRLCHLSQTEQKKTICLILLSVKLANGLLAARLDLKETGDKPGSKDVWQSSRKILKRLMDAHGDRRLVIFGEKEEPCELAADSVPCMDLPLPGVSLRINMWEYFLNPASGVSVSQDVDLPDLADCYDVSYGVIASACAQVIAIAGERRDHLIDREMIIRSIRQINQVNFSGLATYVRPAYAWDDITIKPSQGEVLRTACNRYRLRNRIGEAWGLKKRNAYGNGISVLLYGPPGTGKTMAAQVIAGELGLPLYRVDVSQIFSKYVGETEKNLSRVFDAAARSNVILFFDEADALFAKRTEVSGSNDRYSNSETAYLLQKVEEYDGMSILATNLYANFDPAFLRRITYSVHMESPDEEARYALWTGILPAEAEVDPQIDFRFLADTFELSGSNIKAILYSAAYMAGSESAPMGIGHVVRAMQYEYRKLGMYVDVSQFGPYASYLAPQ